MEEGKIRVEASVLKIERDDFRTLRSCVSSATELTGASGYAILRLFPLQFRRMKNHSVSNFIHILTLSDEMGPRSKTTDAVVGAGYANLAGQS